ncbi:MAG: isochorismatase family cysteine hydrolase [Pseudomonadota bacterium]
MGEISLDDVLSASYQFVEEPDPISRSNAALLLVDVQGLATPEHLAKKAVDAGLDPTGVNHALEDYSQRFYAAVNNCERLLIAARAAQVACIHVKIEALSGNARDTGRAHRSLGWAYPPGGEETAFLEPVKPADGEIIICKTVSGAFTATNLDAVLRHMGIKWLIIGGFETDECIEATGRVALDLGYMTLFAEDACTAYKAQSHHVYMEKYAGWGLVRSTHALMDLLAGLEQ